MTDAPPVTEEVRENVLWITLNRPHKRNALTEPMIRLLDTAFRTAESRPVRAIVLTGAGDRAFCAGMDLSVGPGTFGTDLVEPTRPLANLLRTARACRLPIIGRINGTCMAGGMGLLGLCDLAVAADHALFGLPEVKIGVFPMQVLAVLRDKMPHADLQEMCLTGEPVSAQAACTMRLVNYVVPAAELDARTDWLVSRIVDKSPSAIRRGKYALAALTGMTFEQCLAFTETQIGVLALTPDAAEGFEAATQKRRPNWTGT